MGTREPNNSSGRSQEDCAQVNYGLGGQWNDLPCDSLLRSICELSGCGNGQLEPGEMCDDGNAALGDGCDAACRLELRPESEPNEDGSPEVGGSYEGNDFSTVNANGPYEADTSIAATLAPGDEDVFMVTNRGPDLVRVRFSTHDAALGWNVPCYQIDTVLVVRDTQGDILAFNDDRADDLCSAVEFDIPPGETIYAHVLDFGDDYNYDDHGEILTPGYWLAIDFQ